MSAITQITTTLGEMPLDSLHHITEREPVPCGECVTESYYYGGALVRRDVNVIVSPEAWAQAVTGADVGNVEFRSDIGVAAGGVAASGSASL